MPQQPDIVTLSTDDRAGTGPALREAIAVHMAVHGEPETVWEDFLFHHPHWAAPGAHRAIVDNGEIIALTTLAMYRQRFGDTTLPAGEIGLVGTLSEHRGRGHSRRLMECWLDTMREERVPISFLIGIPGYYERWDYQYAAPDQVNHFISITHDALDRCAKPGGAVRDVDPDRDLPAILDLLDIEASGTPCSPVIEAPLLRFFLDRAEAHGVGWQVVEDETGAIVAVLRMKRWGEGIGPQAPGAVTLAAARDDAARAAVAAVLLDHLTAGGQAELPLAIPPHGPLASWLYQRGARRKSDRSIYPGGYAAMYRINDLVAVLEALRGWWDEDVIVDQHAGAAVTLRVGRDDAQVASVVVMGDRVEVQPGESGEDVGAPPAVTVPWVTGWRSAADWLDGTPFPPLPGPAFDPGDPGELSPNARDLLRDLFPLRHPYVGDTTQGA